MRIVLLLCVFCLLPLALAQEDDFTHVDYWPREWVYDEKEILWFHVSDELLVVCREDGEISCWGIKDGKHVSTFAENDYLPNSHSLFLSSGPLPTLGVLSNDGNGNVFLRVLDLPSGDERKEISGSATIRALGNGFDRSGTRFFCYSPYGRSVYCIDITEGKLLWEAKYKDEYEKRGSVQCFADGERFATFFGKQIVMYDKDGKSTWVKELRREYCEASGNKPGDSLLMCWTINLDSEKARVVAVDKEGKTIWESPEAPYMDIDLLAVSTDGMRQAFRVKDGVVLTALPKKDAVNVSVDGNVDVVLTPNGKYLVTLPSLEEVEEDEERNTITWRRKSHKVTVFDASNGKELRSWELVSMESQDEEEDIGEGTGD